MSSREAEEAELRRHFDAGNAGLYEATFRLVQRYDTRVQDFLAPLDGHGRVLDLGCGPGHLTRKLPADVEVVGLDLSPDMVELATALRPAGTYRVHSFYDALPAELGLFDAALALGCLDFCAELPRVLEHLAAGLRMGGRTLLTVCERRAGLEGHDLPRRETKVRDRTLTVYFYSFLEMAQALTQAGLLPRRYEFAPGWVHPSQHLTQWWGWWEVERVPGCPPVTVPS